MSNEEISDYLSPNKHFKKVICLTTGKIFDSITYAMQYYKCGKHIVDCCKGKRETCGKLQDGTKLSWMYYDDYLKNYNNNFNDMAS